MIRVTINADQDKPTDDDLETLYAEMFGKLMDALNLQYIRLLREMLAGSSVSLMPGRTPGLMAHTLPGSLSSSSAGASLRSTPRSTAPRYSRTSSSPWSRCSTA